MRWALALPFLLLPLGCLDGTIGEIDTESAGAPEVPGGPGTTTAPFSPAYAVMPRLTADQHRNALTDLLGGPVPDSPVEADTAPYLFTTIGAATTTISERGVAQWGDAALAAAKAVFGDAKRRESLVACTPTAADDACARGFLKRFMRRAFRRAIAADELDAWVAVGKKLGGANAWAGLEASVSGILQAPSFLYRIEIGKPDASRPGWNKLDGFEIASRLSFLVWASVPDDMLLDAAENGELDDDVALGKHVDRMMDDARARKALVSFNRQWLGLGDLDHLERDPAKHPDAKPNIGLSMKGEIERLLDDVTLDDRDFRDLFDRRTTWVDQNLASLYRLDVKIAPGMFERVVLPLDGPRAGLLTTAGILAANAHPELTSPTRRGRFVRERILCESVPSPPPDIATDLDGQKEKPGEAPKTVREKLERHRTDPACKGCHKFVDPVGLGLEDFDHMGLHRTMEHGKPVDASGDLDGATFVGGKQLGKLLHDDPRVPACFARQLFRFASGRLEEPSEEAGIQALVKTFAGSGHRFRALVHGLVTNPAFRYTAGVK